MPEYSVMSKIINGSVGSIIGLFCVFPLDLVKTRLQSQQISTTGEKQYASIADCFRKTYRSEGFLGMYRGFGVTLLLITPEKAVKLATNDYVRYRLMPEDGKMTVGRSIAAGAAAGTVQVLISTPMELVKIYMQNAGRVSKDIQEVKRVSAIDFVAQQIKQRGIFGLYRGIGPTLYRDVLFSVIFFPVYFWVEDMGPRKPGTEDAEMWVSFVAGLVSGTVSAFSVTPFDVVKTRMQAMKKLQGENDFANMWDCFGKTFKYEGVKALFKGGLCRVMVLAPLYGIVQSIYYLGVGERMLGYK